MNTATFHQKYLKPASMIVLALATLKLVIHLLTASNYGLSVR